YFLVAHFHFVAVGAIVFAVLGGLQYWFPKMSGRMLSERLGKWSFWLMVIGFNMTFIIQHFLGLLGMPRRVFTYPDLPNFTWMNMLSTTGVFFMSAAALVLVWNLATSFFRGKVAGGNPWDAWTLEWATTSPPPHENFVALPPIRGRRPLWDLANPDRPDPIVGENSAAVTLPDHNKVGILSFILSETGFFAALILAYLYFYARPQAGPGPKELNVPRTLVFSVCLFASSFTFWRSEVALTKQHRGSMLGWLALTILLGGIFLVGQGTEYWKLFQTGVDLSTNLFFTTFFTLTGFHGLDVLLGLIALLMFLLAFISPFNALANGYLFSAHMLQHILLVLIVPALLVLSLPRSFSLHSSFAYFTHPLIGWIAGVGAMWLWHAPTLCNAAATSRSVSAIQTISLLLMGTVFWWQVLAPCEQQRLSPLSGIVYLFTACTACSVLGIILTFAPVS